MSDASSKLRVYFTTTVPEARKIIRDGFTDLWTFGDQQGVWVGNRPLDMNDGFEGDVTLAVTIPAEVFSGFEASETDPADPTGERWFKTGRAIIPAEVLNQHGPAQIYDHQYAGLSRRDLLHAIRLWKADAEEEAEDAAAEAWKGEPAALLGDPDAMRCKANELQAAFDFFEEIGWMTPLRVSEEQRASGSAT